MISLLLPERALREGLETARAAWPDLHVPDEVFLAYVNERVGDAPEAALRNIADLYLACACARGESAAIALLEQLYLTAEVEAACRRASHLDQDDLKQRVRAKLFVKPALKIAAYAGRSSLRTWLRAVIGRLAIDASRERPRDAAGAEVDFREVACGGDDPDRVLLKQMYGQALEHAFHRASERLSSRDKNLLRYALSEGLNIDQIGRIYNVHRATAFRWLRQARESLVEHIRAIFVAQMKMSDSEFDSVLRLVMSQFDVTIARAFGDGGRNSGEGPRAVGEGGGAEP